MGTEARLVFSLIPKRSNPEQDYEEAISIMRRLGENFPDIYPVDGGNAKFSAASDGYIYAFTVGSSSEQRLRDFNNALMRKYEEVGLMHKSSTSTLKAEGKSDCFIATVAFEGSDRPEINMLRLYRELHLKNSMIGKMFIRVYYYIGPVCAKVISRFEMLKKFFKQLIQFIVIPFVKRKIGH